VFDAKNGIFGFATVRTLTPFDQDWTT